MAGDPGSKVCIIGLDGATFTVLDRWMAAGEMPNLREMVETGVRGELMSTIPPVTGPAWTSMTTGVNPGKHGIYDFFRWPKDSRRERVVRSTDCTVPRIWDLAGEAGLRVGVYHVPITYPARPVNGFMVTGLLTTREDSSASHPPELWEELSRRGLGKLKGDNPREDVELYTREKTSILCDSRRTMAYLLERFQPDLFMCVVSELDHIQHHAWEHCVRGEDAANPELREITARFFHELDDTIGMLRRSFGDGTTYFIVSDHGFGPVRGAVYINNYLVQKGFLRLKKVPAASTSLLLRAARPVKLLLKHTGLLGLARTALRLLAPGSKLRMHRRRRGHAQLMDAVDWNRTLACALSMSDCGIHLNRRDRWSDGTVEPGPQAEKVLQDLIGALHELEDPETRRKVVSHIRRPTSVHTGPCMENAPDLFLAVLEGELAVSTRLGGPVFGSYEKVASHRMEGVLVASGPGIKKGVQLNADILDVAPTVLHVLGQDVPGYMEGRVLQDAFTENGRRPVRRDEVPLDERRLKMAEFASLKGDETVVKKRLADLGYI